MVCVKWSCTVKGAIFYLRNDIAAGVPRRQKLSALKVLETTRCFQWKIFGNGLLVSYRKLILKSENKDRFLFCFVFHNPSNGCAIFSKWLPVTTMLNSIFDQRIILMNKHSKVYYVIPILKNLHIILSKNGNRHGWDGHLTRSSLFFPPQKSETQESYISLFENTLRITTQNQRILLKPSRIFLETLKNTCKSKEYFKTHKSFESLQECVLKKKEFKKN